MLIKHIILRGVMAIQSGDNPRVVEQKLKTFLPAVLRGTPEEAAA
jgi:chemotaxis protein MotA